MKKKTYECNFCNPDNPCILVLNDIDTDNYTPDRCPISEEDIEGCVWKEVENI